ncbi:4Fe-4S binding protein [Roseobacter sinensis]|uniref:4Fe-4S binding protein n=1 Tax=Roseobacter sinensis TaxID=2931391 RepID=A0ABT3BHP4_9RHOB|nr:4Fe-4S binding protein [Roseobacter sp. WL0113]MCV3273094.1 4Fe-4S binding protein [Roseobacter sp. WL0113]
MAKKLVVCDCLGSQAIDPEAISGVTGVACSKMMTEACGSQIAQTAEHLAEGDVMVACQQQAPLFRDLADEIGAAHPQFVDLRDRGGWSDDGAEATAKMAALVAEAQLESPPERTIDIVSSGACLIIGSGEVAEQAAENLAGILAVTVLRSAPEEVTPGGAFDVVCGELRRVTGSLGQFDLRIDRFQEPVAGGRGSATWTAPKDGALSNCDVILDLSGGPSLFPAPEKRDGYLRADPGSQSAVAKAVLDASQLIGTFEKPLYVRLEEPLCAHSRAEKPACSKCLDACPTGAITSAGEHVAIDPMICAGCGACASLCPSAAITYDAPPVATLFARIDTLARSFRAAGGQNPRLLVQDEHGAEMISLSARYGRGLPADVIPFAVSALAGFGHAEMLAALASGFADVAILLAPRSDRAVLQQETELANAIAGGARVRLLDLTDPDALSAALYDHDGDPSVVDPILPLGSRRQVTRLAAKALQPEAEVLPLPETAPYGALLLDQEACTLCLSCVSLCPAGALGDNPDKPQLRFQEDACLQCGLCANICPETAITLQPQLNLTDAALAQRVLHEEEPFACVECGSLFGSKSTVERIMEKLAGKHAMFSNPQAARMIQMCDNCRIQAQYHSENNPFAGGERPAVRTTDDYLSKRKDH